jgi:hypothetical protein
MRVASWARAPRLATMPGINWLERLYRSRRSPHLMSAMARSRGARAQLATRISLQQSAQRHVLTSPPLSTSQQ